MNEEDLLNHQVAGWRAEIARLHDLIEAATGNEQPDRSETAKEAFRELAHIENWLEKSDAPQTVRNRTIDLRACISELTIKV